MKALLATLCLTLALVGCDTMPKRDAEVLIKYKYIVNTIPEELLAVPPQVTPIDLKAATDKDVGAWMLDSEKRSLTIEGMLKAIRELQVKRLEEAKKLPAEDVIIK